MSAAEALVAMLGRHRVDTVFCLCGDTSLPFYDALYRTGGAIRHVPTRDERHAGRRLDRAGGTRSSRCAAVFSVQNAARCTPV